jgi:thioredoxin 1
MICSYLIQHTVGQVIQQVLIEEDIKMTSEPIHITDEAFEKVVLQSALPVIVDFWAPWCGPCKMVAPILDKLAKEFEGKLIVAKINTDEHAEWMQKFGIQGIPTMLFVSGGKVVHRQVGALPERMLRDVVAQFMDVPPYSNRRRRQAQLPSPRQIYKLLWPYR